MDEQSGPSAVGAFVLPHERPTEMRDFQNVSGPGMGPLSELLAEAELRDQVRVTLRVLATEIIEERAALVDHHEQAAARMVVLRVALEVLGQVDDALG